jgi:hypothetical protein
VRGHPALLMLVLLVVLHLGAWCTILQGTRGAAGK